MALFDKLGKILTSEITLTPQENEPAPAPAAQAAKSGSLPKGDQGLQKLLASADMLPKENVKIEDTFGDFRFSFDLSGDFIPFNSHSEFDPAYQYAPYGEAESVRFEGGLPVIAIGPDDNIYYAATKFEKGSDCGMDIKECDNPCFLFSVSFTENGLVNYAYVFGGGTSREYEMLCLQYNPRFENTDLEKKLKNILDVAAASYKEEKA